MTRATLLCLLLFPAVAAAAPERLDTGLPAPPPPAGVAARPRYALPHLLSTTWRDFNVGLYGDAFASYRLTSRQDQIFHEFELTRLLLGGWVGYREIGGVNLALETVRSSGGRSYFGVDGDSLLPRVRHAFIEVTPLRHWLALRGGVIPDPLLPWAELSWDLRAIGPMGLEREGLTTTADLGAQIEAALPFGLGSVALAYGNGEGQALREQNNGKNTTAAIHLRPARWRLPDLLIHALYRDGSIGAGSAADRRLMGGLTYVGPRSGAGAIATWAMGYRGAGNREAAHLMLFARRELPWRFLLFARGEMLWPDSADPASLQARVQGGLSYALPLLVRLHLAYEGIVALGAVAAQVPAVGEHALSVVAEARL